MSTAFLNFSSCFNRRINLIILFTFLLPFAMNAQKAIIHGKIVAFDSIPVEKAEIKLKRNNTSALSDSLGFFSIECQQNDKLSIRVAGFKTKKLKVKSLSDSLNIQIEFGGSEKDIEDASGHGHLDRESLVYATDYLDADLFVDSGYTDVIEMITSKFPGVNVVGDDIIIRGKNSLNGNNSALIVIDGVTTTVYSLRSLSVADVKSVNVLKGNQAAPYGSRGANGVVVVITK